MEMTAERFTTLEKKAKTMSEASLRWSAADAWKASLNAEGMVAFGASKSAGYYADEHFIYTDELRRRGLK
jgi:hypothetical protein